MNVLSLCDGMSCGYMALKKVNIPIDAYFASEIKKEAIVCSQYNFKDIIHIGDLRNITYKDGVLYTSEGNFQVNIDILLFGSPCETFSRATRPNLRTGLQNKAKSGLFFECKRILDEVKPKYFLFENVVMKADDLKIITEQLGVEPIRINSSLVSAQLRDRLYWTNIPNVTVPKDRNICLSDILTDGYTEKTKARCLTQMDSHGYFNGCNWHAPSRYYREHIQGLTTMIYPNRESYEKCVLTANKLLQGKKPKKDYFEEYNGTEFDCLRYLNKIERARLQTVDEKYVDCLNEQDASDLLGDGWTVDIIAHILSFIKDNIKTKSD